MFALIDVNCIIKEHYRTLLGDSKLKFILLIFFLIPLLLDAPLIYYDKLLTEGSAGTLITAFAIFTGLLLNVIFIIYDIVDKMVSKKTFKDDGDDYKKFKRQKDLLEHLYANSLYSLLTSLFILVFLIAITVLEVWDITNISVSKLSFNPAKTLSFIVYFLIMHFLMNLLMITKRLSVLLSNKLKHELDKLPDDETVPHS